MNISRIIIIIANLLALTGCYLPITGRVIDAESQQPIEGAIVLVEWTKKHGFGDHWTESYKVVEVLSDKEGKVKIEGCYSPFVEPPDVTVYKKGYVAWNNYLVFPTWESRKGIVWGNYVYKLEHFRTDYSFVRHTAFIHSVTNTSIGQKTKIENAYRWEELEASKERDLKNKSRGQ